MHEDAEVLWCVLLISHTWSCVLHSSPISTAKLISLTTTINIFTSFPARHMHSRPLSEVQLHFFDSFLFSTRKILSRGFFFRVRFFFLRPEILMCCTQFYTRREQKFSIELWDIAQYGIECFIGALLFVNLILMTNW